MDFKQAKTALAEHNKVKASIRRETKERLSNLDQELLKKFECWVDEAFTPETIFDDGVLPTFLSVVKYHTRPGHPLRSLGPKIMAVIETTARSYQPEATGIYWGYIELTKRKGSKEFVAKFSDQVPVDTIVGALSYPGLPGHARRNLWLIVKTKYGFGTRRDIDAINRVNDLSLDEIYEYIHDRRNLSRWSD